MTPFGRRVRELRKERGVTQKEMAEALNLSAAYISALERGHRGAPPWDYVQRVISFFNVIWDDAEELQQLAMSSHPRVIVDTTNLSIEATEFANFLASNTKDLKKEDFSVLLQEAKKRVQKNRSR